MFVLVRENILFHYGVIKELLPQKCRGWHEEGNTLSVSLCPIEWFQLFPNQERDAFLYSLTRRDGAAARFLDLSRLSKRNLEEINAWSNANGFGTTDKPNLQALNVVQDYGALAIYIAWGENVNNLDGIWFSDPIGEAMKQTSRGGIFQGRLNHFRHTEHAPITDKTKWPKCRLPVIELACHDRETKTLQ